MGKIRTFQSWISVLGVLSMGLVSMQPTDSLRHASQFSWAPKNPSALATNMRSDTAASGFLALSSHESTPLVTHAQKATQTENGVTYVGGGQYDDTDAAWKYSGVWRLRSSRAAYRHTLHISTMTGSTASVSFTGTGFTLTYRSYLNGGKIKVYLDDSPTPLKTIHNRGNVGLLKYRSPQLTPGNHTVTFRHAGPAGAKIGVDAIAVAGVAQYYVDGAVGSDMNPGTLTQPFKSINKALDIGGNEIVTVETGTYDEQIDIRSSSVALQADGKVTIKAVEVSGNWNVVKGFTITDPSRGAGIWVTGSHNLLVGNEIYHTKQDGIWFFGSYNTFRGNYIHDILDPSIGGDPHVDCFQTWGWDWNTTNVLFERNICIHNRATGDNQIINLERKTTAEVRDITFRNNVFVMYDPGYSPMNFYREAGQLEISNIRVISNSIIHVNGIGNFGIRFGNITNAWAVNNLFIDYGKADMSYIVVTGGRNINIHNNAVYKTDGIPPMSGPYPGDVWMQDPKVVDLRNLDLHLTAQSPLIDRGAPLPLYSDFDGNHRPQGAGFDIGAFEWQ